MSSPHSEQSFATHVRALAQSFDVTLAEDVERDLCRYLALVAEWNEKIDLTAARTPEAITEVLVADAFVLARETLIANGARVLDVGTGAGGPALPLFLMRRDLRGLWVESQRKRGTFLRMAIEALDLRRRVTLDDVGINSKKPTIKQAVDVAMSRATFAPELWLSIGAKVAPRTLVLTVSPEPIASPPGVTIESTVVYQLPSSGAPRAIHSCRRG